MVINQFSGCFALVNYSATIFRDSGSDINPHMSSIILAAIQVAGTYTSTLLVDKLGRRVLLITSAAATSAGLTVMGVYSFLRSHLEWEMAGFSWVPVTSLSFVIFIASIGILPLPFVVLAEVLPQNVNFAYKFRLISPFFNKYISTDSSYRIDAMCHLGKLHFVPNPENVSGSVVFAGIVWMHVDFRDSLRTGNCVYCRLR